MLGSMSVAALRSMPRGLGGRLAPGPEPGLGPMPGRLGSCPVRAKSMAAANGEAREVTDCDLPHTACSSIRSGAYAHILFISCSLPLVDILLTSAIRKGVLCMRSGYLEGMSRKVLASSLHLECTQMN